MACSLAAKSNILVAPLIIDSQVIFVYTYCSSKAARPLINSSAVKSGAASNSSVDAAISLPFFSSSANSSFNSAYAYIHYSYSYGYKPACCIRYLPLLEVSVHEQHQ
jgi:hypothetical protein